MLSGARENAKIVLALTHVSVSVPRPQIGVVVHPFLELRVEAEESWLVSGGGGGGDRSVLVLLVHCVASLALPQLDERLFLGRQRLILYIFHFGGSSCFVMSGMTAERRSTNNQTNLVSYGIAHALPQAHRLELRLFVDGHHVALEADVDHLLARTPEESGLLRLGRVRRVARRRGRGRRRRRRRRRSANRSLLVQPDLAVPFAGESGARLLAVAYLALDEVGGLDAAEQRLELELDVGRVAGVRALDLYLAAELHGEAADEYALAVGVGQSDRVLLGSTGGGVRAIEEHELDATVHDGRHRVAVELGTRLQIEPNKSEMCRRQSNNSEQNCVVLCCYENCAVYAEAFLAVGHVEAGDGRMMRDLFGHVEGLRVGRLVVPVGAKALAQYRIVGLLESLGLLVEARQVELDHALDALQRIVT